MVEYALVELRPGDCVESAAGVCREVERTRVVPGSITVYNFTVEKAHTYFVGKGAWWVHNRCRNFATPELFDRHYNKHAREWTESITKMDYLNKARTLLNSDTGGDILGFTSKSGWIFRYNQLTNEFATATPNGIIETLFKPTKGLAYYLNQIIKYGQ